MRIAIIVVIVLIIVGLATWFGIYTHTIPATTITSTVTRSVVETRIVTTTVSTTVAQPTTITETKTFTKTVTTISTKLYTHYATITTTKLETTTRIITIPPTTITKTITETRILERNLVLETVSYDPVKVHENLTYALEIGERIAAWIAKANSSVYGILKARFMSLNVSIPITRTLEAIESKGVNISLVGEMPESTADFVSVKMARQFCRWMKGHALAFQLNTNVLVIDKRIVILIGWTQITVIKSMELAKQLISEAKYFIEISKGSKPIWCHGA